MAGCGDVLSLEDLQTAKKHQIFEAEVITGKAGGKAGGADIAVAVNQVTGQIQTTLPEVLNQVGFKPGSGDFNTGFIVMPWQRDTAWLWPSPAGDNNWYSWSGEIPNPGGKVVPAASSPSSTGGVSANGWRPRTDETLRSELPRIKYYEGVSALKAATNISNGDEVCSGKTNWDVKSFSTFGKCLPLQNGLFAYPKNAINILDFGADNTGVLLANTALNDAADVGPVYAPPGRYRIENFELRVQPGNTNIGQEKLVIYGDLSPYTLQHQYMVTPAIFEGDGDLFKKVVNYAFANIGVRNRSSLPTTYPDVPGTLFSMYGKGLEAGVFIGCYFGACLRHFSQVASGGTPTTADDYMIGPNYDACSFFHAIEYSRYFDGVVANYSETGKCYTSHSKRGLYMKSPGPGVGLTQSVYEYIDDEAIIVDAYGFVANHSVSIDRVFMESCGGDLAVIAGQTKPEKAKAIPSVKIATIAANGAKVLFEHNNCFATYTGAHPPVAHFSIPTGNGTTTVQMVESGFLNGVTGTKTYTADTNTYVDPFTTGNSLHQIKDGVVTTKGLTIGGGQRAPNAPLDVESTTNTVAWLSSATTSIRQVLLAQGIAADFGVDATGFFFSQLAGSKDLRINAGDAYLDRAGKGLVLRSPNGLVTRRITINDAGAIVVS